MSTSTPQPDTLERAILTFVLARHPASVHGDELARAFRDDDWRSSTATLEADGLLHVECRLYLAARAAVRAAELLG